MKFSEILKYYSKKSVREIMVIEAKDREFCWMYSDGTFGKRPSVLLNENDILELVKKKAVSFHISVERWSNPLLLKKDMKKSEMDKIRIGWDLLIDIDSNSLEISRILGELIVKALKEHGITRFGIKFSGSKGFHIVVPFESFPEEIDGKNVKDLFPEMARIVGEYLFEYVKEDFENKLINNWEISEIAKMVKKPYTEIVENGRLKLNEIASIDTIVMSKRHLFRCPYSLNEKSWLVSVPIDSIKDFEKEIAKPEYVEGEKRFLPEGRKDEAKYLFEVAYEWYSIKKMEEKISLGEFKGKIKIRGKIDPKFFPPCIKNILRGLEDGRKRALWILVNFLLRIGYDPFEVERIIWEWNERNKPPLKDSYVKYQLKWHSKLKEPYMPPNCDNENYYKDIGVCEPDSYCEGVKNPLVYVLRRYREWLRRERSSKSSGKK